VSCLNSEWGRWREGRAGARNMVRDAPHSRLTYPFVRRCSGTRYSYVIGAPLV